MNIKIISVIVLIVFVVLFVFQNISIVEVHFLFWSLQISRALLIFCLLLIGIAIGWLLHAHFKGK
ncbi:LapA family protein [Sulfurovum sp. XGS-02]|uniref:LapA family protein n=1 Tax=Sulfurovum sp. XGS-02 TaxID=2925411 RepID=UPI00205B905C|nr:LapA family protein [Sulfurovum sp. XGS-02]UPT78563.1 LapA family protein [Sulfurovum sp. XGS-02]